MDTEHTNDDRIDAYLRRTLSDEEHQAFKQQLKNDPELKEQVLTHLEHKVIARMAYKDKIQQWRKEAKPSTPLFRQPLAIAATVLLLIITGAFIYANAFYTVDKLVTMESTALAPGTMQGDEDAQGTQFSLDSLLQPGLTALLIEDDYERASAYFSTFPDTLPFASYKYYYSGYAHFLQENYEAAITSFNRYLAIAEDPEFTEVTAESIDKIKWARIVALAKQTPEREELQAYLNDLIETGRPVYREKAAELKRQLDSFWRKLVVT